MGRLVRDLFDEIRSGGIVRAVLASHSDQLPTKSGRSSIVSGRDCIDGGISGDERKE